MVSISQCAFVIPGASISHFDHAYSNSRKGYSSAGLHIIQKTKYKQQSSTQLYIPDDISMKNRRSDHRIRHSIHPQNFFIGMFGKYFTGCRQKSNSCIFKFHTIASLHIVKLYHLLPDNLKRTLFHT